MKRVVLIANRNNILPYLFNSANKLGIRFVHLKQRGESSLLKFKEVESEIELDMLSDLAAAEAALNHIVETSTIDGIYTTREELIPWVSQQAQRLGFPYISPETALNCRDKSRMRFLFEQQGVRSPHYQTYQGESYAQLKKVFGNQFILKPKGGFGSAGVCLVSNEQEFVTFLDKTKIITREQLAFTENLGHGSFSGLLVEEFCSGDEYVVETFVYQGQIYVMAVGYKGCNQGPFFEEGVYVSLDDWSQEHTIKLIKQAKKAVTALGVQMGPSHTELRMHKNEAYVIESAARIGGGGISHFIVEESRGIDFFGLHLRQCISETISQEELTKPITGSASNFIVPLIGYGIFQGLEGVEQYLSHPDSVALYELMEPGITVAPYPKFTGFPGFALSKHANSNIAFHFQDFCRETLKSRFNPIDDK